MKNPFEEVARSRVKEEYFDVEDSRLRCQACGEIVSEGKWYPRGKVLVWSCSAGHESRVEGIDL